MMIGHDDIDTARSSVIDRFIGSDTRVAGDQELRTIVDDGLERLDVDPVAFFAADRDVINNVCAQGLQCLYKDRGGCLPIHIEVAPDTDQPIEADCLVDDLYGMFNSGEWSGGKGVGMQERARRLGRVDAASQESLRDQRRQVEVCEG